MPDTYKTFPYKGFGGGLNLHDSPDVVSENQAIDALNVLFNVRGSVAQRGGYAKFSAAEGANRYDSLAAFYKSDGTKQLVAGAGNRLDALNTAGAVIASIATPTASPHYFQRFGGPTAEHIYIANGVDAVRRWTGLAFETPVYSGVTPSGRYLGLSVTDNRLVNARFPGTTAGNNPSTVRFSAEGDPLTFGTTQYVDLTPGDGEEITGVASWRDQIIVFKETKFFVFYGNTADDDGDPVFNYRPVDAGVGLVASRAKVVAEQGVYFLDRSGVYFTTGSQPALVSENVEPIFHGSPSIFYTQGTLNDGAIDQVTMMYFDQHLWVSFPAGVAATNTRNLVFDPFGKWWTIFDIPASAMTVFRPGSEEELIFAYASGTKHIGRYRHGAYTADDMTVDGAGGTAINAFWQSGWFGYGTAAVKTIREAKIAGSGIVTVSWYVDYRLTPSASLQKELSPPGWSWDDGTLWDDGSLWGPATVIQAKAVRRAVRGEAFSLRFSNNVMDRSFTVNRFTTHVREVRVPSVVRVN